MEIFYFLTSQNFLLYFGLKDENGLKFQRGKMDTKKEQILKVAGNVFAKFGLKKTTMDEIAKIARMGKSTIYYYFKSKESIFAEVIDKESRILKQELSEAIAKATSPQQKIKNYMLTRMKHLKKLINYNTSLTDDYLSHYSFVENARKDFTQYEIHAIKDILINGIDQNIFAIEDASAVAVIIVNGIKALEHILFIEKLSENIEKEIDLILNIIFKGIEKR